MDDKKLDEFEDNLYLHIKDNQQKYPFIAKYWDIKIVRQSKVAAPLVSTGKYQSKLKKSYPFYKPYCKIVDMSSF